jgi:glycosyltransferase involved in cell wall biosynthesis
MTERLNKVPRKILFVVGGGRFFGSELPLGGTAGYLKAAVQSLPAERYESVFLFLFEGPTVRDFEALGRRCLTVKRLFRGDLSLAFRIARIVKREKPDLVVTAVHNGNLYGRLAARIAGAGKVASVVSDYMSGVLAGEKAVPFLERLGLWQEKLLWRLSDRIVTPCETLRGHMSAEWGIPAERIVTIPGVIDASRPTPGAARLASMRNEFGVGEGQFLVGTMCRIAPVKNLSMLLRAAERVEKEAPGMVRFAVAGEGPLRAALEEDVRRRGLEEAVRFTGWLDDTATFAAAADAICLTSHSECHPTLILEAMAASRPVVATAVGGVVRMVADGETGLLVDPDDDEAMARFIVELARDRDLAQRIGKAGRNRVEELFSPEQARRGFEQLVD